VISMEISVRDAVEIFLEISGANVYVISCVVSLSLYVCPEMVR